MQDLKQRTKRFALDTILFVERLPRNETCHIIGKQLLRAGTAVGANYRATRRARSPADFIYKMGVVEEEVDESAFWLELLIESGKVRVEEATPLLGEAQELTAIAVASINTARQRGTRNNPTRKAEGGTRKAEGGTRSDRARNIGRGKDGMEDVEGGAT